MGIYGESTGCYPIRLKILYPQGCAGSIPARGTTLRPDGATRGAATGSPIDLGEAVPGIARRAATGWSDIGGMFTLLEASIFLIKPRLDFRRI